MTYQQAETIAKAWIQAFEPSLEVDPEATITRPYGWVFLFRPAPGCGPLAGGPRAILIEKVNGEVMTCGTGDVLELVLVHHESRIPPACLTLRPEFPPGGSQNRGDHGVIDPYTSIDEDHLPEVFRKFPRQGRLFRELRLVRDADAPDAP